MPNSRRIAVLSAVLLLGGCGLLDALDKFKGITFQLPSRTFTVSTMDPNWRSPPAGGIPALSCGAGGVVADCCAAPSDCTRSPLVCEANKCALKFDYEETHKVELGMVEELKGQGGSIFSQVLLKQIDLQVDNQLNVTTPPVNLFVAPANVTSATNPAARRIAIIPMQAPGFKGPVSLPLDEASQQAFSNFARDFQTPFNLILSTGVLIRSGDPIPMGRIVLAVGGLVEAKL